MVMVVQDVVTITPGPIREVVALPVAGIDDTETEAGADDDAGGIADAIVVIEVTVPPGTVVVETAPLLPLSLPAAGSTVGEEEEEPVLPLAPSEAPQNVCAKLSAATGDTPHR